MPAPTVTVDHVRDPADRCDGSIANYHLGLIEERSTPEPNTGCWLWLGPLDTRGYANIRVHGKRVRASRLILGLLDAPTSVVARHRCDNPPCVNPAHLVSGTQRDNAYDMLRRGRGNKARGDDNGARKHPDRLARGAASGMNAHPESRSCGDRNGSRLHPERLVRGEVHPSARLTVEAVREIRASATGVNDPLTELANRYGVSTAAIRFVILRRSWRHIQ